jgi:hypothetical protein
MPEDVLQRLHPVTVTESSQEVGLDLDTLDDLYFISSLWFAPSSPWLADLVARLGRVEQDVTLDGASVIARVAALQGIIPGDLTARLTDIREAIRGITSGPPSGPFPLTELEQFIAGENDALLAYMEASGGAIYGLVLESTRTVLSAIAGIQAPATVDLTPAIDRVRQAILDTLGPGSGYINAVNALGDIAREIFRANGALSTAVTAAGGDLEAQLAELARAVTAGLKPTDDLKKLGEAATDQADAAKLLADQFDLSDPAILDALEQTYAGLSPALLPLLARLGKPLWAALVTLWNLAGPFLAFEAAEKAAEHFPVLASAFGTTGRIFGDGIVAGIEALHEPAKVFMRVAAAQTFEEVERELAATGRVTPENVMAAASRLFAVAGALGMSSHLVATVAEKIHGAKHLGFSQLAAFLTDHAGFGGIARNSLGAQFEAALRSPARRRANKIFRPERPSPGQYDQMFLEGRVTTGDYFGYYAEQGWTEEETARWMETVYREASPRELALVFEDGKLDEPWALQHLTESGFTPNDADRLFRGVRNRALKSYRAGLLGEAVVSYANGLLDVAGLVEVGRRLELGDMALDLVVATAERKRVRDQAEEARTQLLSAFEAGMVGETELAAVLQSAGYDPQAAQHAVTIARLRLGRVQFKDEQADRKRAVREAQRDALQGLRDLYRRFLIGDTEFVAALVAYGFTDDGARAALFAAQAARLPVPRLADVLTPEAEAQIIRQTEADAVLAQLRNETITDAAALAALVGLGLSPREARAEVTLVLARLRKPAPTVEPPTPTEQAREAQRLAVEAAVAQYRAGQLDAARLRAALLTAGETTAAAGGIVAREEARRAGERAADAAAERARSESEVRRAEEAAAIAAYQAGALTRDGLLSTLLAAGDARPLAESIVRREEARRLARERLAAERAAEQAAERERAEARGALLAEFRAGALAGPALRAGLVALGVPAGEADAIVRRETAARTPRRP